MFYIFLPCFIYLCHFHVASLFIYAAPRFQSLLYYFPSFMLRQNKFMLHQHNNFMLHQDLSAVPFFPSPHTVRRYRRLHYSVVLSTLQELKLQGITTRNDA